MITAGVPVTVAGADQPLAEQNAVSQLLTALGAVVRPDTLTDDVAAELLLGAIGDADALYLRRLRRELFRLAAAAGEPEDAELIVPVLTDPGALATLPPRLHRPLAKVADVLAAGRAALADGGKAEDVLWAIWSATGLGPGLGAAEPRGRRVRAPRPTATSTRCSTCSTPPPVSPTGCPRPPRWPCTNTSSPSSCRWRRSRVGELPATPSRS